MEQLPLVQQLEKSLIESQKSFNSKKQGNQSVVSFEPSGTNTATFPQNSRHQIQEDRISNNFNHRAQIFRVQEQIRQLEESRQKLLLKVSKDSNYDEKIQICNQNVQRLQNQRRSRAAANTNFQNALSRESNATTTKATAEFNRSSFINYQREKSVTDDLVRESSGYLKPRDPPPRPDSPPMIPPQEVQQIQQHKQLNPGRQTFGVINDESIHNTTTATQNNNPDVSWAISPLDNKIQQNYQSEFMSGSGVKNAGLIKLFPLNYGKTPSPQRIEEENNTKICGNLYREKFKPPTNLQPITCQSPDQKQKYTEDSYIIEQQEDYISNNIIQEDDDVEENPLMYQKSQMEGTGSIVCSGSPPKQAKAFQILSSTPKIKKTDSKTSLLLQGKIGSSSKRKMKWHNSSQPEQNEVRSLKNGRHQSHQVGKRTGSPLEQKNGLKKLFAYRSPANRYDTLLSEQSDTPGKTSHRSKQSGTHLFQNTISKNPTNIDSSRVKIEQKQEDSNRSYGSPLRPHNKITAVIAQQLSDGNDSQSCFIDLQNCYSQNTTPNNNQISSRDRTTIRKVKLPDKNTHRSGSAVNKDNKDFEQSPPPTPSAPVPQARAFSPLRQSSSNPNLVATDKNSNILKGKAKLKLSKINSSSQFQDGIGSEQRKQRQIEKLRKQEAIQKRKGPGASPTRPKVSGGMSRKPNFALKKQLLRVSINNSNQKLNNSLMSSRRDSHNIDTFNMSQNQNSFRLTQQFSGSRRGGAIVRNLSKTPRTQQNKASDQKSTPLNKQRSKKNLKIHNDLIKANQSHIEDQQALEQFVTKQLQFHENNNRTYSKKGVVGSAISRTNSKPQIGMKKRRQKSDFVIGITAGGNTSLEQSHNDIKRKDNLNVTTGAIQIDTAANQYKRQKKSNEEQVKKPNKRTKKSSFSKQKYVPHVQKSRSCKFFLYF